MSTLITVPTITPFTVPATALPTIILTMDYLEIYRHQLVEDERADGTIENYLRDLGRFIIWTDGRPLTKELMVEYKKYLATQDYAPRTINAKLSPLNTFFVNMGWPQLRVKFLRIQQQLFRDKDRELTEEDYKVLIDTAIEIGMEQLSLVIETLGCTGMRVGELKNVTVENVKRGRAVIYHKGKVRTIVFPEKMSEKLLKYAKKEKIANGEIFITESGKSLNRRQIWAQMKRLCKFCDVEPSKVFPHNLRHLFAVVYFGIYKDIVKLAGMMGHSNIETTRIYLLEPCSEHQKQLDTMGLVY